jgi:translocation and assembly module TamB
MDLWIDEVDLRANGRRIDVVTLRGRDANGGRVRGSGYVDLGPDWSSTRVALEAAFEDLYLAKIDELRLRGDGSVRVAAGEGRVMVAGDFAADQAIVRIPSRLPPDIATLPVEHVQIAASRRGAVASDDDEGAGRPVELDVTLRFPSRLRIEDPNLDSEWRGRIRVAGDTRDPDVQGALTITRGTFAIGGVRFRAREGTLSFDETNNVPVADIVAVASRNDIEATLRLSGRLDRIEFVLTSEPPLPQDEILSRLMFGSTTATLTPGQAIQLAQAVARLSGHGPQVDVISRVRRFAGVDRIEIKDTEGVDGPGTAVSVGKYLTNRVYLSVDQAVDGVGSKARVEVEVTEHIAAETEMGQDENASIGVKWRWSY